VQRVKSIDLLTLKIGNQTTKTLLVTVSSDGLINLYDTTVLQDHTPCSEKEILSVNPLGSYNTNGTRLTCVTFAENGPPPSQPVAGSKQSSERQASDPGSSSN
jgi:protein MAK11